MTFAGILAFNYASLAGASEFSCPVDQAFLNHTCTGTVRVQSMEQLNAYKNTLGVVAKKPTIAKGLLIDFSPVLSEDLSIATPCMIKTAPNITITTSGNVCLNGKRKVHLDEGFHFSGNNLNIESTEDIVVNKNSVIVAQDIKLLSKGSQEINQAFFREGAQITAANVLIETHNVGFIGKNSNLKLSGTLSIHALGDEEASIRQGTVVVANKIDVNSTGITKIANLTNLTANEITLVGAQGCEINKGSVMTATDRIGNCFLKSLTKESFSIDKNRGTNPLTISFNSSTISNGKGFIWDFGDGQTLSTLTPTTTHTYSAVGSFTASLKYATKENYKGLKSAGSVQIDVKAAPVVPTTPPRGYFNFTQDGTFVYLKAFIRRTQFDIASAYYVVDDNQNNKIYMTNFYANSQSNVEMHTYGWHKVVMYVEDVQGQKYNTTVNMYLEQEEKFIGPFIRFYGDQSAIRTAFINMSSSFIPLQDEILSDFVVDFGDGQSAEVTGATSVVHTYAVAGTYSVKVSAQYGEIVRSTTIPITVTDIDKPILKPVAFFDYHILDFAGNVTFADDRSGTPNGEIISYEWDFGGAGITYGKRASHFFTPGEHLVTLTVTDMAGLRSSQTQKIKISDVGDDLVSHLDCWEEWGRTLGCNIFALDKDNQISRVKVEWGDGTSQLFTEAEVPGWGLYATEHTYQNYGQYTLKLTVDTSRGQTKYAYFNQTFAASPPVADIYCYTSNLLVSCNALGSYNPQGSPLTYIFDYGDSFVETNANGISTHAYTNAGTYTVSFKVVNSNGGSAIAQTVVMPMQPINMLPMPQLSCFSQSPQSLTCNGLNSIDTDGYIMSFKFNWGDDTSETHALGTPVTHIYQSGGSRQIILTVVDEDGGVNSISQAFDVVLNVPPVARMNCNSSIVHAVHCDSTSYETNSNDRIVEYKWNLGDGNIVTTMIPSIDYVYPNSQQYTLTLEVKDLFGATNTTSEVVTPYKNVAPFASFNCVGAGPLKLTCYNYSYDPEQMMMSTEWFLNGEAIEVEDNETFSLVFTTDGIKTITIKLTDAFGAISTRDLAFTVEENKAPVVNLVCTSSNNNNYRCESNVTDPDGEVVESRWTIDGKTLEGHSILYEFTNGGEYPITFTATDNLGKQTIAHTLVQKIGPKIEFSCIKTSLIKVSCSINLPDPNEKEVVLYRIQFGEEEIVESQSAEYSFKDFGEYEMIASVLDVEGYMSTFKTKIKLEPGYLAPIAKFQYETKLNFNTFFDASLAKRQGRVVVKFEWDFGDGQSVETTAGDVQHNYLSEGYYQVTLKVTDLLGASNILREEVYIYDAEVPSYDSSDDGDLIGIDSDNDNIRDDVQAWINSELKDDVVSKAVLKKLAQNLTQEFINLEDPIKLNELFSNEEKIALCLSSKLSQSENYKRLVETLKMLMNNTDIRVMGRMKISNAAAGSISIGSEDAKLPEQFCEGN